jgi:predicted Rossmann-fold nucleotide-binding protein
MHERKALMAELSSAFLALPGGLGTPEGVLEATSRTQLRLQDNGFFGLTMEQLDRIIVIAERPVPMVLATDS